MSFNMPAKTTGRVILQAQVVAKEGKGDEVQVLLAAIRKLAESSDEANTHSYRTCRGEGPGNELKFLVFEEYTLPNGITEHAAAEPFQNLVKADVIASLEISYFEEFTS